MILNKKLSYEVAIALGVALAITVALLPNGAITSADRLPDWLLDSVKLRLALKQDASGGFYERTAPGPLALSVIVAEMGKTWPTASATIIHDAALEVAADLLHRGNIEVGEFVGGAFRPLTLTPWAADEKIRSDVSASPALFQNPHQYVFRRK